MDIRLYRWYAWLAWLHIRYLISLHLNRLKMAVSVFEILEPRNNNQVTLSPAKQRELTYKPENRVGEEPYVLGKPYSSEEKTSCISSVPNASYDSSPAEPEVMSFTIFDEPLGTICSTRCSQAFLQLIFPTKWRILPLTSVRQNFPSWRVVAIWTP